VRLQLHALAYNLGNFLRTLATPEPIKDWSLTTLKDKLIKIGAKVVSHGRYVIFQMAEVAIARQMFQEILRLIAELRPQPPPARETFDVMAFMSNRQKECVQMPGKMARSDPRPGVRVIRGAGSSQHLASVLQEGRQNANIDAGLGFIWRISVKTSSFPLDLNGSAIAVGAGRPAAGSVLLERPAALKATELRLTGLSYE
jgi:DDE family transposase